MERAGYDAADFDVNDLGSQLNNIDGVWQAMIDEAKR